MGPGEYLDVYEKSRLLTGFRSPDRPASSSVAVPTELSGSVVRLLYCKKKSPLIPVQYECDGRFILLLTSEGGDVQKLNVYV